MVELVLLSDGEADPLVTKEALIAGLGVVVSSTLDYWFEDSPIGLRIFGNGYMIPTPEEALTGFGNIGVSILLSLRRNE